jgi:23S rRNA pseudouridine955/2504/2580 synthase
MLGGAFIGAGMRSVETVQVGEDDGVARIDRWLRRRYPHLSQGQIEKLIRTGQVRVDGARVKSSDRVSPGQSVRVPPLPDAAPRLPEGMSAKDVDFIRALVIHKDDDVIVLNKPPGLAVQGGPKTTRHVDSFFPVVLFEV